MAATFSASQIRLMHRAGLGSARMARLSAARQEFDDSEQRGRLLPAQTGTFTIPSVRNVVQTVSIAAADATVNLPAGHIAGDEVTIKVSSAAAAHTCTIDAAGAETVDGAATLVLSTDYAVARLISDGTNWLTV